MKQFATAVGATVHAIKDAAELDGRAVGLAMIVSVKEVLLPRRTRRYTKELPRRRDGTLSRFVGCVGQAGDANARVAFVTDVEADQQRCDLFQNARIFQLAAVDGADTGNLCG